MLWWTQRTVSYDGSNVDFGNPLFDEKLDTTPAYEKKLSGVAEVSSHNPFYNTKGSNVDVDLTSSDA